MLEILKQAPIIPVLTLENVDSAYHIVSALMKKGYTTIEVTMRTENAMTIVDKLADEFTKLTIGVGTVINLDNFDAVLKSKAQFAVSPGFDSILAEEARAQGFSYLPGIATASELMQAHRIGFDCVKLFPAAVSGGTDFIKAMTPIFPHVKFCPTGGVGINDIADYLHLDNVVSVGTSALIPKELLNQQDWQSLNTSLFPLSHYTS